MLIDLFVSTAKQQVLDFITRNYTYEYYDSEVFRELKTLGRASVNNALRALEKQGLIQRVRKGKIVLNHVNMRHPAIREFKKLRNLCALFPLFEALKDLCEKIILFGSQSQGTNQAESDADLLLVTENKDKIRRIIQKAKPDQKIQALIYSSSEYLRMPKDQPDLYQEIAKGILIWER